MFNTGVWKYVMFVVTTNKDKTDKVHIPIIFPAAHVVHADIGEAMHGWSMQQGWVNNQYNREIEAVSAGFIDLDGLKCFGGSDSMELESREQDYDIIKNYFEHQGKIPE